MLSFINMGGRKKRQRKKVSRNGSGTTTRGNRRVSRGSGSFMSPGSVGEFVEKQAAKPFAVRESNGRGVGRGKNGAAGSSSTEAQNTPNRSPEIQLEFKHDSLLQSLPEEFLRYRKGSASSSVRELGAVRSSSQAADWTLNLDGSPQGRRVTQEKRRMAPLPSVAPIKIPDSSLKTVSSQSQQRVSRTRRSLASNSAAWASDSEISPVSGLSAARDVIAESFSFSARANGFAESAGKEKESGIRTARQDSATLPREAVWEGAVKSPAVSRKGSTHSIKKRKVDRTAPDLPPFDAFILTSPLSRRDGMNEKKLTDVPGEIKPPPWKDSIVGHRQEGSTGRCPPPPGLTPSAQKLDQVDQEALHRISRILETDAEASSASLRQPTSGSTSGSFSSKSKRDTRRRVEATTLGSPFKVPSALSTPSTYSKYTVSPCTSPAKCPVPVSAGASSANSDYGYESFLEDFDFVGPSSGPSSRGDKSGYSGSTDSPFDPQVPMTAATFWSMNGLKSTPASGSSKFPQQSPLSRASQTMNLTVNGNINSVKESASSASASPSLKGKGSASPRRVVLHARDRSGSASSTIATVGRSPPLRSDGEGHSRDAVTAKGDNQAKASNYPSVTSQREAVDDKRSHVMLKIEVSGPEGPDTEMRQPPLPRFHVTNPELTPSPASTSASPISCRSPDLLDMLIPNGHIVTPISRRQIGRKRSGSPPSPIKITPSRSVRYLPMNGDEDDLVIEMRDGGQEGGLQTDSTPSTGDIQTFPETPVLFSPDLAKDVLSRSNSILSGAKQQQYVSHSLLQATMAVHQPIVIPSTPHIGEPAKASSIQLSNADIRPSTEGGSKSELSAASGSPLISPLQPPPSSPVAPISKVQTLLDTARPSPPLLGPVPKRRTVHIRPPLPFGPRKPNPQVGKGTVPLSLGPRRTASESAAATARAANQTKPHTRRPETPLSTPTFKTTPVAWRGLTLDAAKWTFSSAQLQAIVRTAIEQSAQASSIRLLPQDVFEELPPSLSRLEAHREEIQKNYKVLVRRRRSIIHRLTSLPTNEPRADTWSIVRDAEELAAITASGDKLAEELHDVDDQIAQIYRLRDVHQASALAVALRKLNASLIRQTSETRKLQLDVVNLYAERNEAWRKAEELERELDAFNEQVGSSRPKSVSSSRRSSRVSLARRNSSRTSKAGLRLSGSSYRRSSHRSSGSSLLVHHSTSARSTFSSDMVPPVPPLPILDPSVPTGTSGLPSSQPSTSMPQSSAMPSNSDNLYNAVYDLLGVRASDRAMPSPWRPHSAVCCTTLSSSDDNNANQHRPDGKLAPPHCESSTRLRSGSLPTLIPQPSEAEETGAIIAMLDFRD